MDVPPQPAEETAAIRARSAARFATILIVALATLVVLALPALAGDGRARSVAALRAQRAEQRLLAGHLLRRLGFGPNRRDMREVLRLGRDAYLELQLHPERIDDRVGERFFRPEPGPADDIHNWQHRWFTRMLFSRRQLQEKMTLIWHEHFATSVGKVGSYALMRDQERLLRAGALGSFRDLLIAITKDNAMLFYLDNNANNGQGAVDVQGNPIPPNENYAREMLQLFTLGVHQLNMDGSLVLDDDGVPVPAYRERDVKEIARALSGWYAGSAVTNPPDPSEYIPPASFDPSSHDPKQKVILGEVIAADSAHPELDVERVADVIMAQPTLAPFIAKQLILRLAAEAPSRGYVERVATVFRDSAGDIRATVRAIFTDPEFYSAAVVRRQYKTPIEHVVGAARGLNAIGSRGHTLFLWAQLAGHLPYNPPSVFSFYRPGQKDELLDASYVAVRDQATDMLANGYRDQYFDAFWDAGAVLRRRRLVLHGPHKAIDVLAQDLLAAPLSEPARQVLIDYIGPRVTEEKLRGAAWLLMSSPEYQVN